MHILIMCKAYMHAKHATLEGMSPRNFLKFVTGPAKMDQVGTNYI